MATVFSLAALVVVQLAASAQADAVASLPDVESVLTKATGKARDFAEQASAMQRRVAQQQEKSRAALAEQKSTYESKLAQQTAQSEAIGANITALDNGNKALQKENSGLEAEIKTLQDDNANMRQSLQAIDSKVEAAKLFLEDSLKVTDETDAEELKVLAPTTPKPTLDHFLAVASGAAEKVALLQISGARHDGPEDLVSLLSRSLADIATAEVEGAAELKAHFLANFEEGRKRQEALNATQAKLVELRSELKAHRGKLRDAKSHLEATGRQLRERLHGLRVFAHKVDGAAASSLGGVAAAKTPEKVVTATVEKKPANLTLLAKAPASVAAAPAPQKQTPPPAAAALVAKVAAAPAAKVAAAPVAPVATVAVAPASGTKKAETPKPAVHAEVHKARREASALRKPSAAQAPKPQKQSSPQKVSSSSSSKQQHSKAAALSQSLSTKTTYSSVKTKAEAKTKAVEAKADAAKTKSFMSTWLSALR